MSQPGGVWKFHAPRRVTAPVGVPRSSGDEHSGHQAGESRVSGVALTSILISRFVAPIPPMGSRDDSEDRLPLASFGVHRVDQLIAALPLIPDLKVSFSASGGWTRKPTVLPASSTGQWRACCGRSGRWDSRRGRRPIPGLSGLGNSPTSISEVSHRLLAGHDVLGACSGKSPFKSTYVLLVPVSP